MLSKSLLLRALLVVMVLPAAWFFGPMQLHGHTGYVIVDGVSMEPHLHKGDLVLLSEAASYRVGDVVAYHNKQLGVVVLHRIKRVTADGHYVFKGDNNDFADGPPYPTTHDLIGAKWGRAPRVGSAMLWIRDPLHAIIVAGFALLLGFTAPGQRRSGTVRGERLPARRRSPATEIQLVGAIGVALCAGLFVIALGTPKTRATVDSDLFHQRALYSWSGTAKRGLVYPNGRLPKDGSIFTHLVRTLDVGLRYALTAKQPVVADGTAQLSLDLSGDNGSHIIRPIGTPQHVTADGFDLHAPVDVVGLERLARAIEQETGVRSGSYTLTIVPSIHLRGHVGATAVETSFHQGLAFRLDDKRLTPLPSSAQQSNDLTRDVAGAGVVSARNALHLGPASVGIQRARVVAGWATVIALLGLAAATVFARSRLAADEPARIAARYGDWLVPIRELPPAASPATDVSDFEAILGLAERHDKPIMVLEGEDATTYLLQENGSLYRYRAPSGRAHAPSTVSRPAPV